MTRRANLEQGEATMQRRLRVALAALAALALLLYVVRRQAGPGAPPPDAKVLPPGATSATTEGGGVPRAGGATPAGDEAIDLGPVTIAAVEVDPPVGCAGEPITVATTASGGRAAFGLSHRVQVVSSSMKDVESYQPGHVAENLVTLRIAEPGTFKLRVTATDPRARRRGRWTSR